MSCRAAGSLKNKHFVFRKPPLPQLLAFKSLPEKSTSEKKGISVWPKL